MPRLVSALILLVVFLFHLINKTRLVMDNSFANLRKDWQERDRSIVTCLLVVTFFWDGCQFSC